MKTWYFILYRLSQKDETWQFDNIYSDMTIAQAKLTYNKLAHPTWTYVLKSVDLPI